MGLEVEDILTALKSLVWGYKERLSSYESRTRNQLMTPFHLVEILVCPGVLLLEKKSAWVHMCILACLPQNSLRRRSDKQVAPHSLLLSLRNGSRCDG
jgi:hypothetical protein